MNFIRVWYGIAVLAMLSCPPISLAGVTVFESDDTRVELGGRIQLQYKVVDSDKVPAGQEDTVDDLDFRRLRPAVEFVNGDWHGKVEVDFANSDSVVKNAYLVWAGSDWIQLKVGNHDAPFAREKLTSSKRQQLIERTFVGDHDFGVPDKQLGINISDAKPAKLDWALGVFKAGIDPSTTKVDFVSTVTDDAEYSGNLLVGRVDWYPHGRLSMAQGDFARSESPLVAFGINAYTWRNDDDDVVDPSSDYDTIDGIGIDAAFRWQGISLDLAYQRFAAETLDAGFNGGLIEAGEADFDTWAIEGGYMLLPDRLEIAAGYQVLDADAVNDRDSRFSVGVNYFFDQHKTKLQFTYEVGDTVFDTDGNTIRGEDQNRFFMQLQHVL